MNSYRSSFVAARPWCFSILIFCGVAVGLMPACSTSGTDNTNDNTNANDNGTDANANDNSDGRTGRSFIIRFDGAEAGVSSGVSSFTYEGAGFSGGTVRTVDQLDLYGSGAFSYEVPNGRTVSISFEAPVDLLRLFFVTNGTGQTVLTGFDADGNEVGAITAAQPGSGDEDQTVPLSASAVRAEAVHTGEGEGWIDDFTFRYAASGLDDSDLLEPISLHLTRIAGGFVSPVGLVSPSDGAGRLFVVDQVGKIHIVGPNGELQATFIDLSSRMVSLMGGFDERGLLSMAFHPDYNNNTRFFVCYNAPLPEDDATGFDSLLRVSEFQVRVDDSNIADADSEIILLEIPKPQFNHNGGQLAFGPDGMLYLSVGDGGNANDVGTGHTAGIGNGQDPSNLLGAVLRFDADTPGELNIPADNPFVDDDAVADEIYAYGLRNPWRCSFDLGGANRLFCADVGQNLFEEVNAVEAGGNYGWNIKEATACFDADSADEPPTKCAGSGARGEPLIDPIITYSHSLGGRSRLAVVGGFVYRGEQLPDLVGRYIFGDWSGSFASPQGSIFVAREDAEGQWSFSEAEVEALGEGEGGFDRFVLGFGQDALGEVYVLTSLNTGPTGTTGEVWMISTP